MPKEIVVGSPVTWTETSGGGNSMNLSSKNGTVMSIDEDTKSAVVRRGNNKQITKALKNLRHADDQNELTDWLMSLGKPAEVKREG